MKKFFLIFVLLNLFLLSCNTIRDSAGVNRKVIDEYAVVESPPLVIPPDFNLLPPDQLENKDIKDADEDLAKEILFGLENEEVLSNQESSLIDDIIKSTTPEDVDENIRDIINQEFAGEKSSINDETSFKSESELNAAIKDTENKKNNKKAKKEKNKKRFFFFNSKEENEDGEEGESKKKKRFFFF